MKRLQQRTEYIARRAKQLRKQEDIKAQKTQDRQDQYNFVYARRKYIESVKEAKQARREDWDLGPIAPRRHLTNDGQDDEAPYGTAHQSTLQGHARAFLPGALHGGPKKHWIGSGRYASDQRMRDEGWEALPVDKEARTKQWESFSDIEKTQLKSLENYLKPDYKKMGNHFMVGDRVVVISGHEAGKISEIEKMNIRNESVIVKDLNNVEVHLSKWMQKAENSASPIMLHQRAFHESQLRLVLTIRDPNSPGRYQDSIVDEMLLIRRYNPKSGDYAVQRFMPGTLEKIRGPQVARLPPKTLSNEPSWDDDTLRITSEQVTFTPVLTYTTLNAQGTPADTVLDELRNKYSKRRTRHDPEFIEKMEEIDAAREEKNAGYKKMDTPLMQVNSKIAEEIKAFKTARQAKEGSLESVGQAVWKHLQQKQRAQQSGSASAARRKGSSEFGRALLVADGIEGAAVQRASL